MKMVNLTLPNGVVDKGVLTSDTTGLASWEASAGGGGAYSTSFSEADLVAGVLTVTHNLANKYVQVVVYDETDNQVIPGAVGLVDENTLIINLLDVAPITGTWNVVVAVGSSGQTLGAGYLPVDGDGSQLTGVVHTTGNENIGGYKTFTAPIFVQTAFPSMTNSIQMYDSTADKVVINAGRSAADCVALDYTKSTALTALTSKVGNGPMTLQSSELSWKKGAMGETCFSLDTTGDLNLSMNSSTMVSRTLAKFTRSWADSTDASRKGRITLSVAAGGGMIEGLRMEATALGEPNLGLLGGNQFGGGAGVLSLPQSVLAPTYNASFSNNLLLWDAQGSLKSMSGKTPFSSYPVNIFTQIGGVNVVSTAVETPLIGVGDARGTNILPAGLIRKGTTIRVRARGAYRTGASVGGGPGGSGYLPWKVKIGAAEVAAAWPWVPINQATIPWLLDVDILCLSDGVSGQCTTVGQCWVYCDVTTPPAGYSSTMNSRHSGWTTVTINTTSAQTLGVFFKWDVASADNALVLAQCTIDVVPPPVE